MRSSASVHVTLVLFNGLQDVDAEVYRHLCRLGPSALDLAFPWIMAAFVGHLSPAETLLLWDRIIGFDSLLPLPVLAAAVMTFRCASSQEGLRVWLRPASHRFKCLLTNQLHLRICTT